MPDLAALLSPASVAVVGASPDTAIIRGRTLKTLLAHAYGGRIYPVSRTHAEVQGLKAHASIAALPERVDLAVLIIPAPAVPEELERCGKAGVKAALVLSSGFAEEAGEAGAALQMRLARIARRYDMAVCGPNSEGFANLRTALCPTFSPAVAELEAPLLPPGRETGHVAVIAQSGAVGFSFLDRGRPQDLPISHVVTVGNEACLECFDLVEHLVGDEAVAVFIVFIETIRNAATFRRAAAKALAAGKPILVAKVGASEAGRRAAASHTAALTGELEAYRAVFRRYGLVECASFEELVDLAGAFSLCGGRLPAGTAVGIATASGGAGGWLADACAAHGLRVPELDAGTRAAIDAHIPSYGSSQNPVDGTAQVVRTLGYAALARRVADSPRVDAVVTIASGRTPEIFEREQEALARIPRETGKPFFVWSYTLAHPRMVRSLSRAGIPLFTDLRSCARALAAMAEYRRTRERSAAEAPRAGKKRAELPAGRRVLCEHEALAFLEKYGVRSPAARLAGSAEEAARAAAAIGGRVALKVQSPDIPHKSEAGAVLLGLEGEAVRAGYETVLANARRHAPNAEIHGVLVQAMARPGVELIVGLKTDPTFGPLLLVGAGGAGVELWRDAALAPVPLSAAEARELLSRLRVKALLEGWRGAPPADLDALVALMVTVGELAAEHAGRIAEADLNPVIVHPEGVSVVDALLVLRE